MFCRRDPSGLVQFLILFTTEWAVSEKAHIVIIDDEGFRGTYIW